MNVLKGAFTARRLLSIIIRLVIRIVVFALTVCTSSSIFSFLSESRRMLSKFRPTDAGHFQDFPHGICRTRKTLFRFVVDSFVGFGRFLPQIIEDGLGRLAFGHRPG